MRNCFVWDSFRDSSCCCCASDQLGAELQGPLKLDFVLRFWDFFL